MCVLARNVMHQYIFLILWWALVTMILLNTINVTAGLVNLLFRQVQQLKTYITTESRMCINSPYIMFYILNYISIDR